MKDNKMINMWVNIKILYYLYKIKKIYYWKQNYLLIMIHKICKINIYINNPSKESHEIEHMKVLKIYMK